MAQRYFEPKEFAKEFEKDELVADNLTNLCPIFIEFLPSLDVMRQLITRIKEMQTPKDTLWQDFEKVSLGEGKFVYKPFHQPNAYADMYEK